MRPTLKVIGLVLSGLTKLAAQEGDAISGARAQALLLGHVRAMSDEWRVQYIVDYRKHSLLPDGKSRWTLVGRAGDWQSKQEIYDEGGELIVLEIHRGEQDYEVTRGAASWEATISQSTAAPAADGRCPLQMWLHGVSGKPWSRAAFDHAPIEGFLGPNGELVVRMPLIPNYAETVRAGNEVRGFLCWEVQFDRRSEAERELVAIRDLVSLGRAPTRNLGEVTVPVMGSAAAAVTPQCRWSS